MNEYNNEEELKRKLCSLFEKSGRGYGLDFGTFRSMMAYKDANAGSPTIAQYDNPIIRSGIPSLFWYSKSENKEYVCDEVLTYNGLLDDPKGVCSSVKMKLGESNISLNGKNYNADYITEKIIRRVIKLSHEALQRILFEEPFYEKLVVGVPVRFGAAKRQVLVDILSKATNHKEIVLLPEPIAAAIAYARYSRTSNRKVLVFDLGAGTFDTVLLVPNKKKTKDNPYEYIPKYPDGLAIAGDYFDIKMLEIIIQELRKNPGELDVDKLSNNKSSDYRRLLDTSREAKEKLSVSNTFTGWIEGTSIKGGSSLQKVSVTRDEFESAIRPALTQAVECAYNVLVQANQQNYRDIDILLVGGSTYIPLVRSLIKEKFKYVAEKNILQRFPEQAIALGCAIYANEEVCDTPIAYAYAIGTHLCNPDRDVLDVMIPSNVKRPMRKEMTYKTRRSDQDSIEFDFFELNHGNEDDVLDVNEGELTQIRVKHKFGRKVPSGTPVDVVVELTKSGLLTVTMNDRGISPVDKQIIDVSNLNIGG